MLTTEELSNFSLSKGLDYESLRLQGIAWLEKLAGSEWTDFNAHDPGITILEQVCYALTDLSYRISYDMEDLLCREGEDTYDSLYRPEQILITKPVTLLDLRKQVIDVDGVKNAWIEPVSEPSLFYIENPAFEADVKEVISLTEGEGASALSLQGLYRVLIEKSAESVKLNNDIIQDVSERLHAQRSLAVDFDSIEVIASQLIQLQASVEIDPGAGPEDVYVAILEKMVAYISPAVRFYTLEERLAQGKSIDEIFDGPLLDHGFIDSQELASLSRKKNLYVSDLIREIMDVSGVRVVEFVAFNDKNSLNDTALKLDEGTTPKLDVGNFMLTLKKRQLPVQLKTAELKNRQINAVPPRAKSGLSFPQGRNRHIARYFSLLQQFPKLYGIGEAGLPGNASDQRKAEAKQLKAYLLFFDQLLANSFAQLAHVRDLFSFGYDQPGTYFAACLDDPGISDLWVEQDNDKRKALLQQLFGTSVPDLADAQPAADWQRKNRFLDHLLARFSEQFADYIHFGQTNNADQPVVKSKYAFLHSYNQVSSNKGVGFNMLKAYDNDNCAGLEKSLRLRLGLESEKIYVLEHILLRPIASDQRQTDLPVLSNAFQPDPYSLRVTVVFFLSPDRTGNTGQDKSAFKSFVEQTVRDETPAHLAVFVRWLDPDQATGFDEAYQDWQNKQREFRMLPLNNQHNLNAAGNDQFASIPLRAVRDRLIELLGMGNTYPLRDLDVPDPALVPFQQPGTITIKNSQKDVIYQLFDINDPKTVLDEKKGTGSDLNFKSLTIDKIRRFRIKATQPSSQLSAYLLQTPTITVGLALDLDATLVDPKTLLAASNIADYNATVSVAIDNTQQGVGYQLVTVDSSGKQSLLSETEVPGNGGKIILTSAVVTEDIVIHMLATNSTSAIADANQKQALLTTILPLYVRANPDLEVLVDHAIIDYSGSANITIKNTQAGVSYQAFIRSIADHEFIHGDTKESVLTIPVPNKENVKLRVPADMSISDAVPDSESDFTSDSRIGDGNDLTLNLPKNLNEDSFIAIRATKTHTTIADLHQSTIVLSNIRAVLVKPIAGISLTFEAKIDQSDLLLAPVHVSGGQPGVFYEFTTLTDNKVQGLPVYFHQRDRDDNTQNKGVGQLQVEIDLAVAPAPNSGISWADLPETELSDNVTLKGDNDLSIRAFKAQSGVEVKFPVKLNKTDKVSDTGNVSFQLLNPPPLK